MLKYANNATVSVAIPTDQADNLGAEPKPENLSSSSVHALCFDNDFVLKFEMIGTHEIAKSGIFLAIIRDMMPNPSKRKN